MFIEIEPNTKITVYKNVPITAGQQLVFKTIQSQRAYFASPEHFGKRYPDVTYMRKTGRVRVEDSMSAFGTYNYMSWKNTSFENIEIYARIVDIEYLNNATIEFSYEIDWFQTFMHDLTFGHAVVEREQLSEGAYNRVSEHPHFHGRKEYQMTSPEDLAVDPDMLRYTPQDELTIAPNQWMQIRNDTTGALNTDLVVLLNIVPPTPTTYDEEPDLMNRWEKVFTQLDGINVQTDPDETLPNTLISGWINITQPDNYNYTTSGQARLQDILDTLTILGASSSITGMYAVPKHLAAIENHFYYKEFLGGVPRLEDRLEDDGFDGLVKEQGVIGGISMPNVPEYHPKLNMFPFSYLKAIAPDGNMKEFKYELFNIDEDALELNRALFSYTTTVKGRPVMSMIPQNYMTSTSMVRGDSVNTFNWLERLDYDNIPELPYTTDAYLTYLSNQYASSATSQNAITDAMGIFSDVVNVGSSVVSGATSGAVLGSMGGPAGTIAGGVIGGATSVLQGGAGNSMGMLQRNLTMREANDIQMNHGNAGQSMYSKGRRAFATGNYHPGSGSYLAYDFTVSLAFTFEHVRLNDTMMKYYSDYLWNYGLTSRRQGRPLVTNYFANKSNVDVLPKFHTDPETGETFTYAKTNGIVVYSPLAIISEYVADIFNTGCRFMKGD